MTLVEFLAPLKKASHRDRILAVLYYQHRYKDADALTVEEIRKNLTQARAPNAKNVNIAAVLATSGHYVDTSGTSGNRHLWKLTSSGERYVRELLELPDAQPEIEHDIGALAKLVSQLADQHIRAYVEEALKCLQVGALRACVVFLWAGAIRTLQEGLLGYGSDKLTAALQKHDPKARKVSSIDHFAYIKDKTTVLAALELGSLDKNEKDTLEEALNLRNRCGHPSKYKPGPKKVSSFIEDVVGIMFP